MKFRYYITDLNQGNVFGVNDDEVAENFAACEDYFVVDSEKGEWIASDMNRIEIDAK